MKVTQVQGWYRVLLRLHPREFRERFGDEMLWIFEQERGRGAVMPLFLDGVVSALRQRARSEARLQPVAAGCGLLDAGQGMAPRRFAEAAVTSTLLVAGVLLLLGELGKPFGGPACLPGPPPPRAAGVLRAPVRAVPLAEAERRRPTGAGEGAVDSEVATAVRIVRGQEGGGFATAGYCPETKMEGRR